MKDIFISYHGGVLAKGVRRGGGVAGVLLLLLRLKFLININY